MAAWQGTRDSNPDRQGQSLLSSPLDESPVDWKTRESNPRANISGLLFSRLASSTSWTPSVYDKVACRQRESNSHLLGQSQAYSRWTNRQLVPRAGIEPASRCSSSSRSSELPRSTNAGVETAGASCPARGSCLPSGTQLRSWRRGLDWKLRDPYEDTGLSNPAPWTTRLPLCVKHS